MLEIKINKDKQEIEAAGGAVTILSELVSVVIYVLNSINDGAPVELRNVIDAYDVFNEGLKYGRNDLEEKNNE